VLLGEDHRNRPDHHDRVLFGDVAFLFTGDAEATTEAAMIERGHALAAQALQLGHHESSTSSSLAFLQAVQPGLAIWSASADNAYGHPHAEVLTRMRVMGVTVCGTAEYGTLTVRTDGQRYAVDDGECMQTERLAVSTATPARAAGGSGAVSAPAIATTAPTATSALQATPVPAATAAATATPAPTAMPQSAAPASNCVNINTASFEEVQRIKHIGPERAADLIRLRPYTSVDQLERISGIGPARIRDIKAEGLACVN
jgi:competence protein ComEC